MTGTTKTPPSTPADNKYQPFQKKNNVQSNRIDAFFENITSNNTTALQNTSSLINALQRKTNTGRERITKALTSYRFNEEQEKIVLAAILKGHLRITDILERGFSHKIWSFFTFKWSRIFGKQFSKKEVLQVASASALTPPDSSLTIRLIKKQEIKKICIGWPLLMGKLIPSMALCFFLVTTFLENTKWIHCPPHIPMVIAGVLAICNGVTCYWSRGKKILQESGFTVEKQDHAIDDQPKPTTRWHRKVFFGIVTLLACMAAGATAFCGLAGSMDFLQQHFHTSLSLYNLYTLIPVIVFSLAAIASFYFFQALNIEKNYEQYKKLWGNAWENCKNRKLWDFAKLVGSSFLFFAVYGVLTYYTTMSGLSKIFSLLHIYNNLALYIIVGVGTFVTMCVNMFSQVFKVLAEKERKKLDHNYTELKKNPKIIAIFLPFVLIGNELAYSFVAGYNGIFDGPIAGYLKAAAPCLPDLMVVLSILVLLAMSVYFTWPEVFKNATAAPADAPAPQLIADDAAADAKPLLTPVINPPLSPSQASLSRSNSGSSLMDNKSPSNNGNGTSATAAATATATAATNHVIAIAAAANTSALFSSKSRQNNSLLDNTSNADEHQYCCIM